MEAYNSLLQRRRVDQYATWRVRELSSYRLDEKLSFCTATARRRAVLIEILSPTSELYEKSHLKDLQKVNHVEGHSRFIGNGCIGQTILAVFSNSVSVLHRFRDITIFTVYMTTCDFEKSFSFDAIVEIAGQVCFPVHV